MQEVTRHHLQELSSVLASATAPVKNYTVYAGLTLDKLACEQFVVYNDRIGMVGGPPKTNQGMVMTKGASCDQTQYSVKQSGPDAWPYGVGAGNLYVFALPSGIPEGTPKEEIVTWANIFANGQICQEFTTTKKYEESRKEYLPFMMKT